jgi:hypothetical protein
MKPDQIARMDQASAYLNELSRIILSCYLTLTAGGMDEELAADTARALVIASMELGAYQGDV